MWNLVYYTIMLSIHYIYTASKTYCFFNTLIYQKANILVFITHTFIHNIVKLFIKNKLRTLELDLSM